MNGLTLSQAYYTDILLPILQTKMPHALDQMAMGLVGEGSECFGFDDALSQDHSWGPRICIWLTQEDMDAFGSDLKDIFSNLPSSFAGFAVQSPNPHEGKRSGVFTIAEFYESILGLPHAPIAIDQWLPLQDAKLAAATNGLIFTDPVGEFSAIRERLLKYYPEDIRLRYIAHHAALAAQTGQYNLVRCRIRENHLTAYTTKGMFVEHVIALVYLLNRTYRPFYKWAFHGMNALPILGKTMSSLLIQLIECNEPHKEVQITEEIATMLIGEFHKQHLTWSKSDFLMDHCGCILGNIKDTTLATLPLNLCQ